MMFIVEHPNQHSMYAPSIVDYWLESDVLLRSQYWKTPALEALHVLQNHWAPTGAASVATCWASNCCVQGVE